MTKQESFKRRVRDRMASTGERYMEARRVLIAQADRSATRSWISHPEVSDDAVRSATGRGWNEWCDIIEAWPGHEDGHTAIASHLVEVHGVDAWWSQQVTGGFERITGMRLPYQRPDGTFTASKSRTVRVDAELLRNLLLSEEDRSMLFPGERTDLRSRPDAKTIRIGFGSGIAQIGLTGRADERTTVTIQHERLPALDDVERWKFYWSDWLDALDAEA